MDNQQLTVVDALVQTSFLIQGMLEDRAAGHEVSLIQARLLGILRDREPTINELARLLDLDKSSVSGLVLRAEKRGLVVRTPSVTDRRSVRVELTGHGRDLIDQVAGQFGSEVLSLLAPLTAAEQVRLTELLTRVLRAQAQRQGVNLDRP